MLQFLEVLLEQSISTKMCGEVVHMFVTGLSGLKRKIPKMQVTINLGPAYGMQDGTPVAFFSKKLPGAHMNYKTKSVEVTFFY